MRLSFFLLLLSFGACFAPPLKFRPEDVKERSLPRYLGLKDTNQIAVIKISENLDRHWYVAYNTEQDSCRLFFFQTEKPREAPLELHFPGKSPGKISKLLFEDITHDGENELILEIKYDYGLTFQGRDLIIYQHPFATEAGKRKIIFNFDLKRVWGQIDSFDNDFGMPHESFNVENDAQASYTEDMIRIRGTIQTKPKHALTYKWDEAIKQFKLISEEAMHEATEEEAHGTVGNFKGKKILTPVTSHEKDCKSYVLEDEAGHPIDLPKRIKQALLCSRVVGISPNGQYLVYTSMQNNRIELLDLDTDTEHTLLENYQAHEGVSEIIWSSGQYRALAFVAVDHENYPDNTRLVIYQIGRKGQNRQRYFDLPILYTCEQHSGFCAPVKDYDFRFGPGTSLLYRFQNTENPKNDYKTLNLDFLKQMPN
jgi:hypothetical protein